MPRPALLPWAPGGLLAAACVLLFRVETQRAMPLRAPLAELPTAIAGFRAHDLTLSDAERRAAGVTNYLMRAYVADSTGFSLYVGYYDAQAEGQTIHSPKNCLPGAGWEPIASGTRAVAVDRSAITVNRYIIGKEADRALVYYWYQGRGRVESDEYRVKWELLRDKAVQGRSEEALVRLVLPMPRGPEAADSLAAIAVRALVGPLFRILPAPAGDAAPDPGGTPNF